MGMRGAATRYGWLASIAAAASANSLPIKLTCLGNSTGTVSPGANGPVSSLQSSPLGNDGARTLVVNEQVNIDLTGPKARVRVPPRFVPGQSGTTSTWFDIDGLIVTPDAIDGMIAIGYHRRAKVHFDRRSLTIALAGPIEIYSGRCEPFHSAAQRFFRKR